MLHNNILRSITTALLVIVIQFPSAAQLVHTFEGHEHIICTEQSKHIHQDEPDCQMCDLYTFSHPYVLTDIFTYTIQKNSKAELNLYFKSFFVTTFNSLKRLRAPPILIS